MANKFLATLAGLFLALALQAQNHKVTVRLQDATTNEPVGFATVSIIPEKGQTKYALSDGEGHAVLEKVKPGKYTFRAEIMGYKTKEQSISVGSEDLNLGVVKMELDQQVLDAASVSATGNPIIIKKDTVEYNASSFKISDDNMLVDLLKKLPGIEVSEDGTITSNGETISKITIAGKTFFLDDPQLATQNIPAKLVEKVKVIKKKSEQAEFTGIDDGDDETVIDLTVQKGMMNGLFGNLTAGGGHDLPSSQDAIMNDWRWQGGGMLGRFTEKDQISLILNANNTNNRSFNDLAGGMMGNMMGGGGMMGRGGGFGGGFRGNSNGINTSWMAGLNGNTEFFDGKMDAGGNYVYNGSVIDVLEDSYKETYQTDGSTLISDEDGKSHRYTNGHRFGLRIEHKFSENTSLLIQPQVNFGGGDYIQQSVFNSALNNAANTINDGFTNNTGNNKNFTTNGFMLLRQRLGIPGRTISLNATWNISNNTMDGLNQSITNTYDNGELLSVTPVNQLVEQKSQSRNLGARLVYTEPLGGNFYMEGSYNINWGQSQTLKDVYNYLDGYSYASSPYTLESIYMGTTSKGEKDMTYSNEILNRNLNQNIGLAFMYQQENIRAQLGMSAMPTDTYNYTNGTEYTDFRWNFAPRAMLFADFNDNANVRLFYNGRSSQPSTSQLNPVLDNSNPLLLSLGNPYLTPYFSHNIRNEWEYSNKQTFFSARLNIQGGMVQNPITSAVWYNGGRQYSIPVNGDNTFNGSVRMMINAPIAKSNFSISNTANISYSKNGSYLANESFNWQDYFEKDNSGNLTDNFKYDAFHADYFENGSDQWDRDFLANTTRSLTVMENIRATYRSDYIEIMVGARTRVNKPWYTVQNAVSATWANRVNASFKWTVGDTGLELSTDADYNWYRGYTTEQPSQLVWNASISKQIFRKQATIALKAYDILDQATNITVSDTANYHSEVRNNTLGRYIMATLTWRFGTFGGGNRRMGPGGPGGFRGGPPMGGGGFRPF